MRLMRWVLPAAAFAAVVLVLTRRELPAMRRYVKTARM
jgi:hypothetical protein